MIDEIRVIDETHVMDEPHVMDGTHMTSGRPVPRMSQLTDETRRNAKIGMTRTNLEASTTSEI